MRLRSALALSELRPAREDDVRQIVDIGFGSLPFVMMSRWAIVRGCYRADDKLCETRPTNSLGIAGFDRSLGLLPAHDLPADAPSGITSGFAMSSRLLAKAGLAVLPLVLLLAGYRLVVRGPIPRFYRGAFAM